MVEADVPEIFEIPTAEHNYVAKLKDRTAFAYSVATMDQSRNMVKYVGLSISDAVSFATINPARMQQGLNRNRAFRPRNES